MMCLNLLKDVYKVLFDFFSGWKQQIHNKLKKWSFSRNFKKYLCD